GPGGYQLGAYPAPFAEWNDKYRDEGREFWRGDDAKVAAMAARLSGSAQYFDHDGRAATSSVNFLTAHDGFTLQDTVSYSKKHNKANGENNRDGHSHNASDNCGVEGPSDDPKIQVKRFRRKANLIATLMLSQGTPMMLAGDEVSNSQGGNNNAYCQDNEIGWVDWPHDGDPFFAVCQKAIAFRKAHPILRQRRFLHSRSRLVDGEQDLFWRQTNGKPMRQIDWDDPNLKTLVAEMRMASGSPEYVKREGALLIVLNAGASTDITLPKTKGRWVRSFDTSEDAVTGAFKGTQIAEDSVVVFVQEDDGIGET
ncbi:MAG: glycogen debranching enzyme GlgX, partial [Paracoccaceae bacterium]